MRALLRLALLVGLSLAVGAALAFAQMPPQVTVTWDYNVTPPLVQTGFQVQRCVGAGCVPVDLPAGLLAPTVTTFVDTTVVPGQLTCYGVVALNAAGRSGPATPPVVCGTVPVVIPVPPGVTNLRLSFQ